VSGDLPDVGRFAADFQDFLIAMHAAADRPSSLAQRIREHVGVDPDRLPTTVAQFASTDHANLQLGLDAVLPDAEILGYVVRHAVLGVGFSDVLSGGVRPGPVRYSDVEVGDGRVVQCVVAAVYLARRGDAPLAAVLSHSDRPFGSVLRLECISSEREAVPAFLADLRAAMREHNVFRGKVMSLHLSDNRAVHIRFHRLPPIERDAVILPDGTLDRLERHALGIAEDAERLRAAGHHVKRGILLHGPPGTGKTLSLTYLIGAAPGRTTILLTGNALGLIERAVSMARDLAPATVVFEDVDLVATERTMRTASGGPLFDLLNQMEGVDGDADLLFLLTTNRADLIEPALAARPGRVDLALEIPLPDAGARARLVDLYARGADLGAARRDAIAARTEGVSGAFIRELMRQAALRDGDVDGALADLLADRSLLTRRLLGSAPEGAMLHAVAAAGLPVPRQITGQ
jgi:hypothetical protein